MIPLRYGSRRSLRPFQRKPCAHPGRRCGDGHVPFPLEDSRLAKINYAFEKRQRELAKKKQQDAKQALKRPAREGAKPAPDRSEPSRG